MHGLLIEDYRFPVLHQHYDSIIHLFYAYITHRGLYIYIYIEGMIMVVQHTHTTPQALLFAKYNPDGSADQLFHADITHRGFYIYTYIYIYIYMEGRRRPYATRSYG